MAKDTIEVFECQNKHRKDDDTEEVSVDLLKEIKWNNQIIPAWKCTNPACVAIVFCLINEEFTSGVITCSACRQRYVINVGQLITEIAIYPAMKVMSDTQNADKIDHGQPPKA